MDMSFLSNLEMHLTANHYITHIQLIFHSLSEITMSGFSSRFSATVIASIQQADSGLNEQFTVVKRIGEFRRPGLTQLKEWSVFKVDEIPYVCFVWMKPEKTLLDIIHSRLSSSPLIHLPEPELLSMIRQMSSAVLSLHREEFSHGDIQPQNFHYSPSHELQLAYWCNSRSSLTEKLRYTSGPYYASPAIKRALKVKIRFVRHCPEKSDVYSLGVTILRMATLTTDMSITDLSNLSASTEAAIHRLPYSYLVQTLLWYTLQEDENLRWTMENLQYFLDTGYIPQATKLCNRDENLSLFPTVFSVQDNTWLLLSMKTAAQAYSAQIEEESILPPGRGLLGEVYAPSQQTFSVEIPTVALSISQGNDGVQSAGKVEEPPAVVVREKEGKRGGGGGAEEKKEEAKGEIPAKTAPVEPAPTPPGPTPPETVIPQPDNRCMLNSCSSKVTIAKNYSLYCDPQHAFCSRDCCKAYVGVRKGDTKICCPECGVEIAAEILKEVNESGRCNVF